MNKNSEMHLKIVWWYSEEMFLIKWNRITGMKSLEVCFLLFSFTWKLTFFFFFFFCSYNTNPSRYYKTGQLHCTIFTHSSSLDWWWVLHLCHQVLPPLRDVTNRPEVGSTVRNKLVRLMTHVDLGVKQIAAEFLFVLCKERGRLNSLCLSAFYLSEGIREI